MVDRQALLREIAARVPSGTWQGDYDAAWTNAAIELLFEAESRIGLLKAALENGERLDAQEKRITEGPQHEADIESLREALREP